MNSVVNLFWCWNHCIQLFWLLITTRQAVSAGFWQVYLTQLEKSSYLSFEKCHIILSSIFSAYVMFIVSCISLTKHKTIIWKFRAPAELTLCKVIITRYNTILYQSERMHFYNHPSNYTYIIHLSDGEKWWIFTLIPKAAR